MNPKTLARSALPACALALTLQLSCRAHEPTAGGAPSSLRVPSGVDATAMDLHADPCQDFFQFACGAWAAHTEIPKDQSSWFIWSDITRRNELLLKQILEDTAAGKPPPGTAYAKALGDFYATCTDQPKLEGAVSELDGLIRRIEAIKDAQGLVRELTREHDDGLEPVFDFGAQQDFADASKEIASFDQGGLGLPDRDYYLKDDPKMRKVRELYRQHLLRLFGLLGDRPEVAAARVEATLGLEAQLAKASMDRVARRVPKNVYHPMGLTELAKRAPGFPWAEFVKSLGVPTGGTLNVAHPPFFEAVGRLVHTVPLSTWKSYLVAHEVRALSHALPKRFEEEVFAFTSQALTGTPEDMPRWKKCVHLTDALLGEALARPFVAKVFDEQSKREAQSMVAAIERSFEEDLGTLTWMDPATREQALIKLHHVANKIGYPERWRSYDGLVTDRQSFLGNLMRAEAFEERRELKKIGKEVDRTEWEMTPPTVNAYYEPSLNEMALPAGILQPPLFNKAYSRATNLGATGAGTVGHELTHGFDDEGRQFDAFGNLRDWWTPASEKAFEERTTCVAQQFDRYVAVDDIHLSGKLTLGENVADLGGLRLGYAALTRYLHEHPEDAGGRRLTAPQAFFVAYAQSWCGKTRPEQLRVRAATDPHATPYWRVNGPLSNLKGFQDAFQCKAGDRMVSAHPCEIW